MRELVLDPYALREALTHDEDLSPVERSYLTTHYVRSLLGSSLKWKSSQHPFLTGSVFLDTLDPGEGSGNGDAMSYGNSIGFGGRMRCSPNDDGSGYGWGARTHHRPSIFDSSERGRLFYWPG